MNFSINSVLKQEITKLDSVFVPMGFRGDVQEISFMQSYLKGCLDALGVKSTKAQGLNTILTTTDKFRNSDHIIYLLKNEEANQGRGDLIGFLRVGIKSLYFYDEACNIHHVNPMCVLDFYVLEDFQKCGYGKKLFDYMLLDQCRTIHDMAIDNPSTKMENFLKKNYQVEMMKQNNNFAISKNFFENNIRLAVSPRVSPSVSRSVSPSVSPSVSRSVSPSVSPSVSHSTMPPRFGRFAARQPPSSVGSIIHGDDPDKK